jgi:hypothetical protein
MGGTAATVETLPFIARPWSTNPEVTELQAVKTSSTLVYILLISSCEKCSGLETLLFPGLELWMPWLNFDTVFTGESRRSLSYQSSLIK